MYHALREDLGQEVIMLWHKDRDLSNFGTDDCIVLPGGFSYGDYLRCGALARFSPMMEQVINFAEAGGKVLGVCNGFQILCESGLLPGALLQNDHQKFACKNIFIKNEIGDNIISNVVKGQTLQIPIAHGEGRYFADANTMKGLKENDQIVFRYANEKGEVHIDSNPNGSMDSIAGICNKNKNVFGMMPHPERACSQQLNNINGRSILKAFSGIF
jgi:phosphoribosylformylglycinamidine synthase